MTGEYDFFFQLYAAIHFQGAVAWTWFKAASHVESALDPAAVSNMGARGLMQIMPATAQEIGHDLQCIYNPYDPKTNINFGIHYARKQWDTFGKEAGLERVRFMFGAYNAGPGNILKAQALAARDGMPTNKWSSIRKVLPRVTGEANALQTIRYIERIEATRLALIEA